MARRWKGWVLGGFFSIVALLPLGFALANRFSDSPVVEQAEAWPVVGHLVHFARHFGESKTPDDVGGPSSEEVTSSLSTSTSRSDDSDVEEPLPDSFSPFVAEQVWLEAGEALRRRPTSDASVRHTVPATTNVKIVDRRSGWLRVLHHGRTGWVREEKTEPVVRHLVAVSGDLPVLPVSAREAPAERQERAAALMGSPREGRFGPWPRLTDVGDPQFLTYLEGVAANLESVYRQRYGLAPIGVAKETVFLFATEVDYRAFQADERRIAGLSSTGHARSGYAALWRGEGSGRRSDTEVVATLVHELVHLLNRRALGPALPPWLDEGLAEDLSYATWAADGSVDWSRLGGDEVVGDSRILLTGGRATVQQLADAFVGGEISPLRELVSLDWNTFVSGGIELRYAQSGYWMRTLLNGPRSPGLKVFLGHVAQGGPATGEALRKSLDSPWSELESDFRLSTGMEQTVPRVRFVRAKDGES